MTIKIIKLYYLKLKGLNLKDPLNYKIKNGQALKFLKFSDLARFKDFKF